MTTKHDPDHFDTDVAIVGYGPVGQAVAALRARAVPPALDDLQTQLRITTAPTTSGALR